MDCTLTHDAVGNLTDDGKDYSYVSDAFGRLTRVKNRGNSAVVAEYTYNGLNMRIDWHTSYGIPFRIDPGDYSRDGFVSGTDSDDYGDDFDNTRAEVDVDFDGDVDEDDYDLFSAWWDAPSTAGRFTLSASSVANRIGYAGYQYDPTFVGASRAIYHVRNRVYDAGLGRWTRRDPLGYVDGKSLLNYAQCILLLLSDPLGLASKNDEALPCNGTVAIPCKVWIGTAIGSSITLKECSCKKISGSPWEDNDTAGQEDVLHFRCGMNDNSWWPSFEQMCSADRSKPECECVELPGPRREAPGSHGYVNWSCSFTKSRGTGKCYCTCELHIEYLQSICDGSCRKIAILDLIDIR